MKDNSVLNTISKISVLLFVAGIGSWVAVFFALNKLPWDIFITDFIYFLSVTQGVLVIAIILRLCSARWSGVFYRLSGAVSLAFFPIAMAMIISIIFFKESIFYWVEEASRHPWHNTTLFILRIVLPFIGFYAIGRNLFRQSIEDGKPAGNMEEVAKIINPRHVTSGFFLLLAFVINQTMISWDLGMTLDPHYADTIYSVLFMGGSILCGTAALVLLMSFLKNSLGVKIFTPEHFSNMGQLLLGLTIVIFYFRWSQFFTIWFGNLPEETEALYLRIFSSYKPIYVAMIFLTIVIPFLGLIFKKVRTSERALNVLSASILVGFWLERYLLTAPALVEEHKVAHTFILNPINIVFTLGILGGFIYMFLYLLAKNPEIITDEEQLTGDVLIANAEGWQ